MEVDASATEERPLSARELGSPYCWGRGGGEGAEAMGTGRVEAGLGSCRVL